MAWNDPPGPARSDNCRTVDTPAPPPFPITNHNITILARDALDIMQTEDITIIAIVIVRLVLTQHVLVIAPLGGMLLVYRSETRGRVAPEGGGSINRQHTD